MRRAAPAWVRGAGDPQYEAADRMAGSQSGSSRRHGTLEPLWEGSRHDGQLGTGSRLSSPGEDPSLPVFPVIPIHVDVASAPKTRQRLNRLISRRGEGQIRCPQRHPTASQRADPGTRSCGISWNRSRIRPAPSGQPPAPFHGDRHCNGAGIRAYQHPEPSCPRSVRS